MSAVFLSAAVTVAALLAANIYRVAIGPTVYDRLIGLNVVGTNAVLLLALVGVLFDRLDMFIDLALVYALLSFVGLIAMARYLERSDGPDA